jgi:hypothetical protein
MDQAVTIIQNGTPAAIGISALVLFFGFRFLSALDKDGPFRSYAIQIFALIVILPIVLTLALTGKFPTEATTGLLGTIVGFFFGGARQVHAAVGRSDAGTVQPRSQDVAGVGGKGEVD